MDTATLDPRSAEQELQPLGVPPAQAARLLGCTRQTIYRMLRDGELDSFKVRSGRRITLASIRRLAGAQ